MSFEMLIRQNMVANVASYHQLDPAQCLSQIDQIRFRYKESEDSNVLAKWPMNPTTCYWCDGGVVFNDDELYYEDIYVKRDTAGKTLVYSEDVLRQFSGDYLYEWECGCNYYYYPEYEHGTTNRRDAHYEESRLQLLSAARYCRVKGFCRMSALLESIMMDTSTSEQALAELSLESK